MTLKPSSFALAVLISTCAMVAPSTAADTPATESKGYEFKPHERQALKDYFLTLMLERQVDLLGNYAPAIKHLLTVESLDNTNTKKLNAIIQDKDYIVFRGKIDYLEPIKNYEERISMLSFKIEGERFPLLAFVGTNPEFGVTEYKTGESVEIICKQQKYANVSYQFDCMTYDSYVNGYTDMVTKNLVDRVKTGDDGKLLDADGKAIAYALSAKEITQESSHCLMEKDKCIKDVSGFLNGEGGKSKKSILAKIGITEYNPAIKYNADFSFEFDKKEFPQRLELNEKQISLLAGFELERLKNHNEDAFIEHKISMVNAETLVKTYDENEVEGDSLYLNKTLYITGKIDGIKSGISNKPYVVLKSKKMFQSPQLTFEEPDIERLSKLRKGQQINVVCKGAGEIAGTPSLKDCHFADDFFVKTSIIEAEYLNSKLRAAGKNINKLHISVLLATFADSLYSEHSECLYRHTLKKCNAADAIEEYKKKNDFFTFMYYKLNQLAFQDFKPFTD